MVSQVAIDVADGADPPSKLHEKSANPDNKVDGPGIFLPPPPHHQ